MFGEVKRRGPHILRRPGVISPPLIRAGLKDESIRQIEFLFILEIMLEERQFNLFAIEAAGFGAEGNISEVIPVAAAPSAVRPRTDHQRIRCLWIIAAYFFEDMQRAEKVLRVKPSADGHHGTVDVLQVGPQIARLPEFVICAVIHQIAPELDLPFEIKLVGVGEWPKIQIKLVTVRRLKIERSGI